MTSHELDGSVLRHRHPMRLAILAATLYELVALLLSAFLLRRLGMHPAGVADAAILAATMLLMAPMSLIILVLSFFLPASTDWMIQGIVALAAIVNAAILARLLYRYLLNKSSDTLQLNGS